VDGESLILYRVNDRNGRILPSVSLVKVVMFHSRVIDINQCHDRYLIEI